MKIIFLSFFSLFFCFVFFLYLNHKNSVTYATVFLNGKTIKAEIANNPDLQAKGLSGRKNLENDEGMLFVYKTKVIPYFWMKDMLMPIDIIWISDNQVAGCVSRVPVAEVNTSDNELIKFFPKTPVNYVLEVKAGFCEENNIKAGDSVKISN